MGEEVFSQVIGTVLTGLALYLVRLFRAKILKDIESAEVRDVLDDISRSAEDIVGEYNQREVKKLKQNGTAWVESTKKAVASQAAQKVVNVIGSARLAKVPHSNKRIKAAVENAVRRQKNG